MKYAPLLAAALIGWSSAAAQTPPSSAPAPPALAAAAQTASTTPSPPGSRLTTGTPVLIALDQAMSSNTSKRGDKFPIELAAPIVIDGHTLAPAGAKGVGEVVYADHNGGGGTPGKLVLAARYIDVGDIRIKLKAFTLAAGGDSDFRSLSLASSVISVGVFLIDGGEVRYPVGTKAGAKVAEDVVFPLQAPVDPIAAPPPAAGTSDPAPPAQPVTGPASPTQPQETTK
jgi:hypothetical protein